MDDDRRFDCGLQIRKEVMGEERVAASLLNCDEIAYDLQIFTTKTAWGEIWSRDGLDRQSRSKMTIGMLIALNRSSELKAHIIGAMNNGVNLIELKEMVMHSAIYCGFPAALEAMRTLQAVMAERGI